MNRRRIARGIAAIACAALVAGCGGGSGDSDGVQTITFWHSMSGKNGEAVKALVDRYNEQHAGKVRVEAIYQGKYNDALTKLRASIQSRQTPNLVQVFEIGSRLMYDTKATVPFADLAASGGIDIDALEPGIARYYTIDGKLQSLPFNASAPMLYYNKAAFAEVGLDPEKPPTTLAELVDAAKKLTVRTNGQVTRYGFVAAVDGWLVEQLLANAGLEYCDQGNGRDGLPTTVNWDTPTLRTIVQTWADLINSGDGLNVGRNNTDASAAFQAGRAAILPFTSANLRDIISGSQFEVGVANYLRVEDGQTGGVFNGGGSVWTMAGHPKAEQEAAVDFLKYLASAETQAYWAAQTGYIAINRNADQTATFKEVLATYPDFAKPAAQLRQTPDTPASRGCLMGVMPQARDKMNDIVEAVILGRSTPDQAIAEAQQALVPAIESYNKSVGQ